MAGKGTKLKEREHALLSASSAHKWIACPPSARLEEALPDKAGRAADEGTLAHAICELKLSRVFTDQNMTERTYKSRLKKLQENELYDPEMDRFTDEYVEYVKELAFSMPAAPTVMIEKRLDYGAWAKEGFGTGDCVMLQGDSLHIVDFKYGKGVPVDAEGNPQLALYALGAIHEFGFIYPVEKIVLHIVQPRINNTSSWETNRKELEAWGKYVKERADLAYEGKGEFMQGKHCDSCFCKIAGTCRCRANTNLSLMDRAVDPVSGKPREAATLSNEEVGAILKKAQFLASWVKKLEDYALRTLVSGGEIPGWKLIEGRSNRSFSDTEAAYRAAAGAGYDEALLYEKKPITLTAAEKIIDKETWNTVMQPFVIKPPGKPTLAPEDDKRPAYYVKPSAADAFGGENQYKEEK